VIFLYVAVVVIAGTLPVGFYLGRLYERERAELRRPPAPHEALARVYQMPAPAEILADLRGPLPSRPDPSITERVGKGPA
jgi:hypothetical protein